jgi:hypothetical protein
MLKADRFVVQVILREYDDKGDPVGESPQQPVTVFGLDGLKKYQRELAKKLAAE